jgi:allene oxide cyclase-like protein
MRMKFAVAVIAAVALAVGAVTLASADSNGSSDEHHARVIKVLEHEDQTQANDVGAPGPSLGDEFIFSSVLLRRAGGEQVGTDGGVCTFVRLEQNNTVGTAHCVATASLAGGQITLQGLATFSLSATTNPPSDVAITGGTGAYEGASGHVHIEEVSESDSILTFHLQRAEDD